MTDVFLNPYVLEPGTFPSGGRALVALADVQPEEVQAEPDLRAEALATLLSEREREVFGYRYDDWVGLSWRADSAERADLRDHIRYNVLGMNPDSFVDDGK